MGPYPHPLPPLPRPNLGTPLGMSSHAPKPAVDRPGVPRPTHPHTTRSTMAVVRGLSGQGTTGALSPAGHRTTTALHAHRRQIPICACMPLRLQTAAVARACQHHFGEAPRPLACLQLAPCPIPRSNPFPLLSNVLGFAWHRLFEQPTWSIPRTRSCSSQGSTRNRQSWSKAFP